MQAPGADPSRCNYTNRQNRQNSNFWTSDQFYNWKSYLYPFGRGGAVKLWEEEDELINQLINDKGFCKAAPGFARIC